MSIVLALLCALAPQETRTETWPSGATKAEYQIVLDERGLELRDGPFRSFFEDGQPESTGAFARALREGPWEFFHPNGAKAAAGRFAGGLESGPWETWYPQGQQATKGSYVRGARDKRWTFWSEDGTRDLAASGLYKIEVYRSKEDGRHYRGYFVDNLRQGTWTSYWPGDRVQFEGAFAAGKREGRWVFTHPDGVPSALLLTGEYADGVWAGRSEVPAPPPFDPALFPPLEPAPGGWPERREELAATLREALARRALGPESSAQFAAIGIPALPVALQLLATLDPESAEGRSGMGFLEDQVLRLLCARHALSPHGPSGPPDAPAARELVRAWLSLWLLTRNDTFFWQTTVPGPSSGTGLRDPLQDPPLLERDPRHAPEAAAAVPAPAESAEASLADEFGARFGPEKAERLKGAPSGTKAAIDAALLWLAAHQGEAGGWDNDGFAQRCGRLGKGTCAGPGSQVYDIGATGLALLAFLGDGHTPTQGAHRELVVRALEWLVQQQSPEGLLGERQSFDFIYGHAIATAALCEGYGLGREELRGPAERALAYLQGGRTPKGVWRYDVPSAGDNDTSVTGWAVTALLAAQRAGLAVDLEAFPAVLPWLDDVSDPDSGRVGYSALGELSSRTPANDHFPREKGEAMTAVGLWLRLRLGQPTSTPIVQAHARLIATKPPEVDPEGNDQYFWYYGSYALHALGAPYWKGWEDGLKKGVLATQMKDGEARGSWEPDGPWGYAMGRVCTTALLALTLECYYRE